MGGALGPLRAPWAPRGPEIRGGNGPPWALPDPDPKDWAMAATHFLVFSTKSDYIMVFKKRKKTFFKIPTPDLADYGPEGTWDHLDPVRRTLLYRHFLRRAHHLPPDPNILNAKTKKLKK